MRRSLGTLVVLVVAAAGALGVGWVVTPSTSDAAARIAARNAADGASPLTGPLPPKVVAALVATEDASFFSNPGVDPLGALRGGWGALTGAQNAGGATLEQQLAKILYTGDGSGPTRVPEQLFLAVKLDRSFGKQAVLRMYLSTVYFGDGAYGLTDAARHYFGVTPAQLDWGQAALLAGLVQAPSAYDPLVHLDLARQRQRQVLGRLVATHRLDAAQAASIAGSPLHLVAG